jgi:hypothetical protein
VVVHDIAGVVDYKVEVVAPNLVVVHAVVPVVVVVAIVVLEALEMNQQMVVLLVLVVHCLQILEVHHMDHMVNLDNDVPLAVVAVVVDFEVAVAMVVIVGAN